MTFNDDDFAARYREEVASRPNRPRERPMLDAQNQLRLKTILRATNELLDLVGERNPAVAQSMRVALMAPVTNLQIDSGIPPDDHVEIRP